MHDEDCGPTSFYSKFKFKNDHKIFKEKTRILKRIITDKRKNQHQILRGTLKMRQKSRK